MRRMPLTFSLIFLLTTVGCSGEVTPPPAMGIAGPEAVERSLSTVDPEDSLYLFEYDRQAPLDVHEDSRWREGKATWIDFSYASPKGGRVPARLILPDGEGPFPGLIIQHGSLSTYEDMTSLARTFVQFGAAVMLINDPYSRPGVWNPTGLMGYTWPFYTKDDLSIKIQLVVDLQRAVDLLVERPEVDPERLAYFGVSFGGAMGGLFAGVETRLKAYVLMVGDGGLVEHTSQPGDDGLPVHFNVEWAELMWPTESIHFVGRAAPAALLFLNGIHDELVPPPDAIRYQTAASEPKTILWYDAGHGLPVKATIDAAKWLQPYFGDELLWFAPNYRSTAIVLDRCFTAWVGLVALSLLFFCLIEFRNKLVQWGEAFLWLLVMIILGPLGLVIYWSSVRTLRASGPRKGEMLWRQAFGVATVVAISTLVGFFLTNLLLRPLSAIHFLFTLSILYFGTLAASWLFLLLVRRWFRLSPRSFVISFNIVLAIGMALGNYLGTRWPLLGDSDPRLWWIYAIIAVVALAVTFPLHWWFLHRKIEVSIFPERTGVEDIPPAGMPKGPAILVVVLSYLLIFAAIIAVIAVSTGLTIGSAIKLMLGLMP